MKDNILRLSKSCLGDEEKNAVQKVLDKEFLGMGAEVLKFEKLLTEFFSRPVVCVSNGTAALHIALQAAEIGDGDEVLVQSLTYIASFQAISATGATPVACDVDEGTLCINLSDAEKRLTNKTKAIMPVHFAGGVGALDEVYEFAQKYNLRVIEDAAHAFGTLHKERRVGSFGDIACFSFDGIKNITSGEGGCIVTNDEKVLKIARDARLLGVQNDTEKRFSGGRSWEFDVINQGWRYHMSDIMAAIGIEQLNRFPEFLKKRQNLAKLYDNFFIDTGIETLKQDYDSVVPHIYTLQLPVDIDRDYIRLKLDQLGIQTGVHYYPNHYLSLYKDKSNQRKIVDRLYKTILSIPMHPEITDRDAQFIFKCIRELIV